MDNMQVCESKLEESDLMRNCVFCEYQVPVQGR